MLSDELIRRARELAATRQKTPPGSWYVLNDVRNIVSAGDEGVVCTACDRATAQFLSMAPEMAKLLGELADQLTAFQRRFDLVTADLCSCGGGGPEDPHTCPVCMVWHRFHGNA